MTETSELIVDAVWRRIEPDEGGSYWLDRPKALAAVKVLLSRAPAVSTRELAEEISEAIDATTNHAEVIDRILAEHIAPAVSTESQAMYDNAVTAIRATRQILAEYESFDEVLRIQAASLDVFLGNKPAVSTPQPESHLKVSEARLNNQAENVIYNTFGYPLPAHLAEQLGRLQAGIAGALAVAYRSATPSEVEARDDGRIAEIRARYVSESQIKSDVDYLFATLNIAHQQGAENALREAEGRLLKLTKEQGAINSADVIAIIESLK